jgi:uncharacterized coiled-coil DUF342 family protein
MRREINERFDKVNERFDGMHQEMLKMHRSIETMTRWAIGLLALFATLATALLALSQFAA